MNQDEGKLAEFVELHSPEDRTRLICAHVRRSFEDGATVSVYVPDTAGAEELDESLWTFAQEAFIPHVRLEEAEEPIIEPVVLFSSDPGGLESDLLMLCVDGDLPEWFARFPRIRDFAVLYDDALRRASRRRFAACREAGYGMSLIKTRA